MLDCCKHIHGCCVKGKTFSFFIWKILRVEFSIAAHEMAHISNLSQFLSIYAMMCVMRKKIVSRDVNWCNRCCRCTHVIRIIAVWKVQNEGQNDKISQTSLQCLRLIRPQPRATSCHKTQVANREREIWWQIAASQRVDVIYVVTDFSASARNGAEKKNKKKQRVDAGSHIRRAMSSGRNLLSKTISHTIAVAPDGRLRELAAWTRPRKKRQEKKHIRHSGWEEQLVCALWLWWN